jgi:hypothetical protein
MSIHPEPEKIILRISKIKFIKLFQVSNLNALSKEEFESYINSVIESTYDNLYEFNYFVKYYFVPMKNVYHCFIEIFY